MKSILKTFLNTVYRELKIDTIPFHKIRRESINIPACWFIRSSFLLTAEAYLFSGSQTLI